MRLATVAELATKLSTRAADAVALFYDDSNVHFFIIKWIAEAAARALN